MTDPAGQTDVFATPGVLQIPDALTGDAAGQDKAATSAAGMQKPGMISTELAGHAGLVTGPGTSQIFLEFLVEPVGQIMGVVVTLPGHFPAAFLTCPVGHGAKVTLEGTPHFPVAISIWPVGQTLLASRSGVMHIPDEFLDDPVGQTSGVTHRLSDGSNVNPEAHCLGGTTGGVGGSGVPVTQYPFESLSMPTGQLRS